MKVTTIGIDLVKRDKFAEFFVNLPPCLIGMEACGSGFCRNKGVGASEARQRI